MQEALVNRLGGLGLPRTSVVRLTDRPDITLDVYRGRKTRSYEQQALDGNFLLRERTGELTGNCILWHL